MTDISSPGYVMRIFPRTTISPTVFANGTQISFPLGQHIDVSPFQEVDVLIRVHAATLTSTTAQVTAYSDGYTEEDPTLSFLAQIGNTSLTTPAPTFSVINIASPTTASGRLISIWLSLTQTGATLPSLTLSVDLACKGGDPSGIAPRFNTYRGYR